MSAALVASNGGSQESYPKTARAAKLLAWSVGLVIRFFKQAITKGGEQMLNYPYRSIQRERFQRYGDLQGVSAAPEAASLTIDQVMEKLTPPNN